MVCFNYCLVLITTVHVIKSKVSYSSDWQFEGLHVFIKIRVVVQHIKSDRVGLKATN